MPVETEKWSPDIRPGETDVLSSAIHQAVGAASTCWVDTPKGIFDATQAHEVAVGLEEFLRGAGLIDESGSNLHE